VTAVLTGSLVLPDGTPAHGRAVETPGQRRWVAWFAAHAVR
jgi:hypothetical protein